MSYQCALIRQCVSTGCTCSLSNPRPKFPQKVAKEALIRMLKGRTLLTRQHFKAMIVTKLVKKFRAGKQVASTIVTMQE